jgi:hypothetical protein
VFFFKFEVEKKFCLVRMTQDKCAYCKLNKSGLANPPTNYEKYGFKLDKKRGSKICTLCRKAIKAYINHKVSAFK